MLVVNSENLGCDHLFLFPSIVVATLIRYRDLALPASTAFLCSDLNSMSQHHLCCLEPLSRLQPKIAGLFVFLSRRKH